MTREGAKALARDLTDPDANPPVKARVGQNGPHHSAVVHVTFGIPREAERRTGFGEKEKFTPRRPAPYTIGA